MEAENDSRSSESSRSLTPPQSRIPLSSSTSSLHATRPMEPPRTITLSDSISRGPVFSAMASRSDQNGLHFLTHGTQNKDGCYTYVHMHKSAHADLFEEFCKDKLPKDDVYVPPDLQPINPEEEDDVVPDQHAAYGVQKATQKAREPAWKDLGLSELMARGPAGSAAPKRRPGARRRGGGAASQYTGLPR